MRPGRQTYPAGVDTPERRDAYDRGFMGDDPPRTLDASVMECYFKGLIDGASDADDLTFGN